MQAKTISSKLEQQAKQYGYYAFSRYCRNNKMPIEVALCCVRNVFVKKSK